MRRIGSSEFPFTIMDVASLLRLNIRRRGCSRVVYADCPFCGDRRGKMGLYLNLNTWRCWHCGESGGMLPLYGRIHGISNSEAYREIIDELALNGFGPDPLPSSAYQGKRASSKDVPSDKAPDEEIHRTLTALLSLLTLTPAHREHLRTARGLTDGEIDGFGFKSTPPSLMCRTLTQRLIQQGCRVQGVPGFYVNDYGKWTVKFYTRTAGILIPQRGVDGRLHGLQIRLDHPIRDENDPPDKQGTKYLPLTSTGKDRGVSSGCPIHFVGDPHARVVYVTEGALKADIAHALTGRTFAATVGAGNTNGLDELFAFLYRNGTEEIIEAEDMDKYRSAEVHRGAAEVCRLARKNGMACRSLSWNPNYKGIDDWQLALRRKKEPQEVKQEMTLELDSQTRCQSYRVYQLDLSGGRTVPFAFSGIKKMLEKGYEQPPASLYRLVYDGTILCSNEQSEQDALERIFACYSDTLPKDFPGRNVAPSDVIELYEDDGRAYFYCDAGGFVRVKFSPMLAKPLNGTV